MPRIRKSFRRLFRFLITILISASSRYRYRFYLFPNIILTSSRHYVIKPDGSSRTLFLCQLFHILKLADLSWTVCTTAAWYRQHRLGYCRVSHGEFPSLKSDNWSLTKPLWAADTRFHLPIHWLHKEFHLQAREYSSHTNNPCWRPQDTRCLFSSMLPEAGCMSFG